MSYKVGFECIIVSRPLFDKHSDNLLTTIFTDTENPEKSKVFKDQVVSLIPFSLECGKYRVEVFAMFNYNESLRNFGLVSIALIHSFSKTVCRF